MEDLKNIISCNSGTQSAFEFQSFCKIELNAVADLAQRNELWGNGNSFFTVKTCNSSAEYFSSPITTWLTRYLAEFRLKTHFIFLWVLPNTVGEHFYNFPNISLCLYLSKILIQFFRVVIKFYVLILIWIFHL